MPDPRPASPRRAATRPCTRAAAGRPGWCCPDADAATSCPNGDRVVTRRMERYVARTGGCSLFGALRRGRPTHRHRTGPYGDETTAGDRCGDRPRGRGRPGGGRIGGSATRRAGIHHGDRVGHMRQRGPAGAQSRVRVSSPCRWTTHTLGGKIQLAVSRIKHTARPLPGRHAGQPGRTRRLRAARSRSSVTTCPNAAGDAVRLDRLRPARRRRQRARAEPATATTAGYNRPPYVPTTAAIETGLAAPGRGVREGLRASRRRAARPPEDHRHRPATWTASAQALGAEQINYYGFSYGTYLGQVYATLYPDRVRRMVLDGNVDPRRVWYDANLDQDVAFDRNIKIYFGWVAKHDAVYHLGTTGQAVREALLRRAGGAAPSKPAGGVDRPGRVGPTSSCRPATTSSAGPDSADGVRAAGSTTTTPAPLKALYDGSTRR